MGAAIRMKIDRIRASFSRHLHSYDANALAQRQIAARLAGIAVPLISPSPRVLEAGHGSGFLTRHLLALSTRALWLNDLGAPLPQGVGAAKIIRGDIATARLPIGLDLIASASMLQWIADPEALIGRFCAVLAPDGVLALSSFGPDNFPQLAALGLGVGAPSYRDAGALAQSLPPFMRLIHLHDDAITLDFCTPYDLFAHLRATGVNGVGRGQMSVGQMRALMRKMGAGPIALTYRPSYCIARKMG